MHKWGKNCRLRLSSASETLKVQGNVGDVSLLNQPPNFWVALLRMVAGNDHRHNEFSHRKVRFAVLGPFSPASAHTCNRAGFNERTKHVFNFGGLGVEFPHWASPIRRVRTGSAVP